MVSASLSLMFSLVDSSAKRKSSFVGNEEWSSESALSGRGKLNSGRAVLKFSADWPLSGCGAGADVWMIYRRACRLSTADRQGL